MLVPLCAFVALLPQGDPVRSLASVPELRLLAVETPGDAPEIRLRFDRALDPARVGVRGVELRAAETPPFVVRVEGKDAVLRPVPLRDAVGRMRPSLEPGVRYDLHLRSGPFAWRALDGAVLAAPITRVVALPLDAFESRAGVVPITWCTFGDDGNERRLEGARDVDLAHPLRVRFHGLLRGERLADPVTRRSPSVAFAHDRDGRIATTEDRVPLAASVLLVPCLEAGHTDLWVQLHAPEVDRGAVAAWIEDGLEDALGNPVGPFAPILFWPRGANAGGRREIVEAFDDSLHEDRARTAAHWNTNGSSVLTQGPGGGSGLLGDFAPTASTVLDTDFAAFPASQTLTGRVERVTNGVFHFASFAIPEGVTVRWTGSRSAQIYATRIDVRGTLLFAGEDAPGHDGVNNPCRPGIPWTPDETGLGGRAGIGGPGAGEGGSGGDDPRPRGLAPHGMPRTMDPLHVDGRDAEGVDGRVRRASGGGLGSPAFPATRIDADPAARLQHVTLQVFLNYSLQRSGGGGGGSNATLGSVGQQGAVTGLGGPGGLPGALPGVDPTVPRTARGGAGGGGGGVHAFFTNAIATRLSQCPPSYAPKPQIQGRDVIELWNTGAGGGGGGGCAILQAGRDFAVQGSIDASGGDGGTSVDFRSPAFTTEGAGGGGGSGGNVRLEAGRGLSLPAAVALDVRGGRGGLSRLPSAGGEGGAGFVHVRAIPPLSIGDVARATVPPSAASVGTYGAADFDEHSRATSTWYVASRGAPLRFVDFRVQYAVGPPGADPNDPSQVRWITIDGSTPWPPFPNGPFHTFFQGARDAGGGVPRPGSTSRWVDHPAELPRGADLVRFAVVFHREHSARERVLAIREVGIVLEE